MYDYKELKKNKSAKIKKTKEGLCLIINRFNKNTGEKEESSCIMLHKDLLERNKVEHKKAVVKHEEIVADTVALLEDIKNLEEKEK